jgi:carboxyl-terminal processing protease
LASLFLLTLAFTFSCIRPAFSANQPPIEVPSDPTDSNIAQIEADMLQTWQYSQHPFDEEISRRFFDRYLEMLDYSHMYFLQSDVDSFMPYRTNLHILTLEKHDMSPCFTIFSRFMERCNERINYVTNLLATAKFDFTGHDRFVVNRHALPYAKDMNEVKDFWRQEVRLAYLEQLLDAQNIEFTGKTTSTKQADGNVLATYSFTRDKAHSLDFDHFPKTLLDQNGKPIGAVDLNGNSSNAVVHLQWKQEANLSQTTNVFYSASGDKLGQIRFQKVVAVSTNQSRPQTNFEAVIDLVETNFAAIKKDLTTRYLETLDRYKDLDSDRVFENYMNALAHAYDPHSDYMGRMDAENFAIQMKLSLGGIGAILSKKQHYCVIDALKDGPAKKSGQLGKDDRIVAVAQSNAEPVDVIGWPLDKIVEMIRGPKGTQVTLTVIPSDSDDSVRKEVTLTREEIKLEDQAAKATLYEIATSDGPPIRLGLVDLTSFYADNERPEMNTTADVTRLVDRLKKEHVDGIILDMRHNGGGYLEEAIKLTGLFNPKGPVVQTRDPNGEIVADPSPESGPLYTGPLVALTDVYSASASEILAGALQDYGRALIVGDHSTFGKGSVQTMQRLAPYLDLKHMDYSYDPGELKVTIKKFYRAGGVSTQLQGVLSDIELPSIDDVVEIGERFLSDPMPCDSVTSADHLEDLEVNRVKPYLAELQARSKQRLVKDKDFAYLREDIAEFRKEQDDKSLSLNEAERRSEQDAQAARMEERKKERLSRKTPGEKIYEISLKNVDSPKLQPLAANAASKIDNEDDSEASQGAAIPDPGLEETKRIMLDYIELLKKGPAISRADSVVNH